MCMNNQIILKTEVDVDIMKSCTLCSMHFGQFLRPNQLYWGNRDMGGYFTQESKPVRQLLASIPGT